MNNGILLLCVDNDLVKISVIVAGNILAFIITDEVRVNTKTQLCA